MIYGFFSDAHGDLAAFQASLAALSGADRLLYLGDVAGGPRSAECIHLLRSLGIACVKGNHDLWKFETAGLSAEDLEFLDGLPLTLDEGLFLALHSLFDRSGDDIFFQNLQSSQECSELFARYDHRVLVVGHSHTPCVNALVDERIEYLDARRQPRVRLEDRARYIINVGSARDCAVIYDSDSGEVTYRFHGAPDATGDVPQGPRPAQSGESFLSRLIRVFRPRT